MRVGFGGEHRSAAGPSVAHDGRRFVATLVPKANFVAARRYATSSMRAALPDLVRTLKKAGVTRPERGTIDRNCSAWVEGLPTPPGNGVRWPRPCRSLSSNDRPDVPFSLIVERPLTSSQLKDLRRALDAWYLLGEKGASTGGFTT